MFFLHRPDPRQIARFIRESKAVPLSYRPPGPETKTALRNVDELVVRLGRGKADFERARGALARWKQFDLGWVELFPRNAPVDPGTDVAVLIRHLAFWSLNGCRVVHTVGRVDDGGRFGFAYGALANHAEAGEELFEVFINPGSNDVMYRIRAVSWPQAKLARAGYPIVRLLQARFRRDSVVAMKRATCGK